MTAESQAHAGFMPATQSIFKTPELEKEYMAAYEAVLALWPVPHAPLEVQTQFGTTHVNACGPQLNHVVSQYRCLEQPISRVCRGYARAAG
jgi:hypothetical protein